MGERHTFHHLRRMLCAATLAVCGAQAAAQSGSACGELANGYGPYDYRTDRTGNTLSIVEGAHFLPFVEALIRGNTAARPGGDIDYTLRAFPNHHRALLAATRLAERERTPQPSGMRYTIECYFDRAIRFRPDDLTVRMLFARRLYATARADAAASQLDYVARLAADNPFTHYNLGLVYLEGKDFKRALEQAHIAQQLGFPRTELRDALRAAGRWVEPPAGEPAAGEPATAASAP